MSQSNPSWRDRYYAADLDKVQAIILELKSPRRRIFSPVEQASNRVIPFGQNVSCLEISRSASPHQDPSPTTTTSTTSIFSFSNGTSGSIYSGASTQPSSLNSSPTEPSPNPSNGFPTPPLPSVPFLRCSTCGQSFKGAYRSTNLQRHMRSTHLRRVKLVCPEPGCSVECSRTDNLRKHQRVVHGLVKKITRQSTVRHDRRKTC